MTTTTFRFRAVCLLAPAITFLAGCSPDAPKPGVVAGSVDGEKASQTAQKGAETANKKADDHGHWWCAEHGVPEEECSMCSAKVAKTCKANGDWCDKHDRAKSQCFICDPSLKEKFAAKYRTKYGKEPPPIEDEKNEK